VQREAEPAPLLLEGQPGQLLVAARQADATAGDPRDLLGDLRRGGPVGKQVDEQAQVRPGEPLLGDQLLDGHLEVAREGGESALQGREAPLA
jgi:hypothetical protein